MGMGGARYCKLLVDGTRQFYIPRKASALVFVWGPWKKAGFNIARDEELQKAWIAEVRAGNLDLPERLPVEVITPPPVSPPDEQPVDDVPDETPVDETPTDPPVSDERERMLRALLDDIQVTSARWKVEIETILAKGAQS